MENDVMEGFLCPICHRDLRSVHKLQSHFESAHSAEDKAVVDQIKGLFSKAKGRILRRDESFEHSINPSSNRQFVQDEQAIWEPQEIGTSRNHLDKFKKIRDSRIDRLVVESNKVLIRLDKLLLTGDIENNKRKEFEQTLVPWVKDEDVPFCPTCGNKFMVTRRRHHCRLCGAIMCTKCSMYVSFELADELVQTLRKTTLTNRPRSRSALNPSTSDKVDGVLRIRCCSDCHSVLARRKSRIEKESHQPLLVLLYEKLRNAVTSANKFAPDYEIMAGSLNRGEEEYELNKANDLRFKIMKLYETMDVISKKIASLDIDDEQNPPSNGAIRLHGAVRSATHAYLQDNMLTLQSLPSLPKLEVLQKERRKEKERRLRRQREEAERERQEQKRRQELEKLQKEREENEKKRKSWASEDSVSVSSNNVVLNDGWIADAPIIPDRPSSQERTSSLDEDGPIREQIMYVQQMISQAESSGRYEEAKSLTLNLEELKAEHRRQRARRAFAGSDVGGSAMQNSSRNKKVQPRRKNGPNSRVREEESKLVVNKNPFLEQNSNPFSEDVKLENSTRRNPEKNPFFRGEETQELNPFLERSSNPFSEDVELENSMRRNQEKNPFLGDEENQELNSFSEKHKESRNTKPSSTLNGNAVDPMLEQIRYISDCLDKAVRSGKRDEANILRRNLRELKSLYNKRQ